MLQKECGNEIGIIYEGMWWGYQYLFIISGLMSLCRVN